MLRFYSRGLARSVRCTLLLTPELCGLGVPGLRVHGTPAARARHLRTIRCCKTDAGYPAITKARDYDGKTRSVERWAKTKVAADRSLELALRDRSRPQADGDITRGDPSLGTINTGIATIDQAETWYAGLANLSPSPSRPTSTDSTSRPCRAWGNSG
jgi:hypothetical protein